MRSKRELVILFVLLFFVASLTGRTQPVNEKVNILFILVDDLGWADLGYNGSTFYETPNIDWLAAKGMSLTDAHSSSGVCSPSLYTMLTGRYHWRTSLQSGIVGLYGKPLITPGRLTLAGLVKQQGYQTVCIGKWHLGWDWLIPEKSREMFLTKQKKVSATDN
jgi:arylsulfatase A-like enzyme